jgi:hypothetical protein
MLDTYYIRKNLEIRPEVNGMVEADLPEQCALSSDMTWVELHWVLGSMPRKVEGQMRASPLTDDSTSKNSRRQKQKHGTSDIIMAIREIGDSKMNSALTKERIQFIDVENTRLQNERS